MNMRIVAAIAVAAAAAAPAWAQQPRERNANDVADAIEETLAAATRECRTINERKTRQCVKDYRARVTKGQLIVFRFEDWRFEFANFMALKPYPTFRRFSLDALQPEIAVDRMPGLAGEKESAMVVMKCREGKCVATETGASYESGSIPNIDNVAAAGRVKTLLVELIAMCKAAPKACE